MKHTFLAYLIFAFSTQWASAQVTDQRVTDAGGDQQLLGQLTQASLSSPPFNEWFDAGADQYNPDGDFITRTRNLQDFEIEVFMGTWCGDSRREVPRLIKTLRALNFPEQQLSIVGVNRTTDQYKQSPNGEQAGKNIHRVPTIIFYRNGKEVNRIVETPVTSIEEDIHTIVSGGEYEANYPVVSKLESLLANRPQRVTIEEAESIAQELKPLSINPAELASYGYVELYGNNIDKAAAIFEINRFLFPTEPLVYEALAASYYHQRRYTEAGDHYRQVLELDAGNDNALKMLDEIASKQ